MFNNVLHILHGIQWHFSKEHKKLVWELWSQSYPSRSLYFILKPQLVYWYFSDASWCSMLTEMCRSCGLHGLNITKAYSHNWRLVLTNLWKLLKVPFIIFRGEGQDNELKSQVTHFIILFAYFKKISFLFLDLPSQKTIWKKNLCILTTINNQSVPIF